MTVRWFAWLLAGLALSSAGGGVHAVAAHAPGLAAPPAYGGAVQDAPARPAERALLERYCVGCHNDRTRTQGLSLASADLHDVGREAEIWEKVTRKLRARAMPPAGSPRPAEADYLRLVGYLEHELDRAAAARPDPGRAPSLRRLNRTEYRNAIRDVLALDVEVTDLLPPDDSSYGFDNISVTGLSPTLMERYLSAANKVSRLAVGSAVRAPASRVVNMPPDLTQEARLDGLPFGTRGGAVVSHTCPVTGEYAFRIRLARNRNENVEGLNDPHELELAIDGARVEVFTVKPDRNRFGGYYADEGVDQHLEVRTRVTAGPHDVRVTFLAKTGALIETERQPYLARFNADRHPRTQPALGSLSIEGPYEVEGVGDTPSRRRIFTCTPAADPAACARTILAGLARRAYRRPVTDGDLQAPLGFYRQAYAEAGGAGAAAFEAGIEMALRALLASPEFLFRIERDPVGLTPGTAYRVSDVALASRLSFFLWSGPPDDELLALAERGALGRPGTLDLQVERMLADPRARALASNFAGQWLHLRNLAAHSPDGRLFPDFDDNLRQALRRETELLFEHLVAGNRPVTELLTADYTFLNERLARHYGISHVYGDHFRRVPLGAAAQRTGILGHGSVLTVTSYANRTSPVLRGKWILENVLGMPPPPPPPDVPPLPESSTGKTLSMRERMSEHRRNAVCATCHQVMDPAGLAMENFDAIGRWRTRDESGRLLDVSGSLPGGPDFDGVAGLRQALLARPDVFASTLVEKLLTFGLGRGVDYRDGPAVRAIVREAAGDGYRMSSIVRAVVRSTPFQMRRSE
jgi:mono/diheme cytochrome c family protein